MEKLECPNAYQEHRVLNLYLPDKREGKDRLLAFFRAHFGCNECIFRERCEKLVVHDSDSEKGVTSFTVFAIEKE